MAQGYFWFSVYGNVKVNLAILNCGDWQLSKKPSLETFETWISACNAQFQKIPGQTPLKGTEKASSGGLLDVTRFFSLWFPCVEHVVSLTFWNLKEEHIEHIQKSTKINKNQQKSTKINLSWLSLSQLITIYVVTPWGWNSACKPHWRSLVFHHHHHLPKRHPRLHLLCPRRTEDLMWKRD